MIQRIIDSISASGGTAMRLTSLALATAIASFITASFLCAAAFISALQTYGPVRACLAGSGIFFLLTLAAAACYLAYKKRAEERAATAAKTAAQNVLTDPMLIATGLQIARAIGVRRLLPVLAVGGLALGIIASRNTSSADASTEPAE